MRKLLATLALVCAFAAVSFGGTTEIPPAPTGGTTEIPPAASAPATEPGTTEIPPLAAVSIELVTLLPTLF